MKDEKIVYFMQERDYFRAQALRLDNDKNGYIRQINDLKMKLMTLKDDKKYFETFVIEARKENKELKEEIRQGQDQKEKELIQFAKNDYYSRLNLGRETSHPTDQKTANVEMPPDSYLGLEEDEIKHNVKYLKERYLQERLKNRILNKKLKEISGSKMELLIIMQNCINEVKRDIHYRKIQHKIDSENLNLINGTDLNTLKNFQNQIESGPVTKGTFNEDGGVMTQDEINEQVIFLNKI